MARQRIREWPTRKYLALQVAMAVFAVLSIYRLATGTPTWWGSAIDAVYVMIFVWWTVYVWMLRSGPWSAPEPDPS